jgi:hypothetical protein
MWDTISPEEEGRATFASEGEGLGMRVNKVNFKNYY